MFFPAARKQIYIAPSFSEEPFFPLRSKMKTQQRQESGKARVKNTGAEKGSRRNRTPQISPTAARQSAQRGRKRTKASKNGLLPFSKRRYRGMNKNASKKIRRKQTQTVPPKNAGTVLSEK